MRKINYIAVGIILTLATISSCSSKTDEITNINIIYNNEIVDSLNKTKDEIFTLSLDVFSTNKDYKVDWTSSDTNVAIIDNNGKVLTKNVGTTIISATSQKNKKIKSSIFLNVKEVTYQSGAGTGFTKDDPIYIGNEGKEEPLQIYFIEMRQMYADSIYIKKGNVDILIDSGEAVDGELVSQILNEKCTDKRLDLVVASHGDSDHIAGFPNALKDIENVSTFIDYGGMGSGTYASTRDKFIAKGAIRHTAYDCVNFTDGITSRYYLTSEFYVDVLDTGNYIKNNESTASNPNSVALIFTYKDFKFFTAGDLTTGVEQSLVKRVELPNVTLYKASHHGSNGSNSSELLNTLNPKGVGISAARSAGTYGVDTSTPNKNNSSNLQGIGGHPYEGAIERIYQTPNIMKDLRVYWNMVNGTMCFTSYGENDFTFKGSPTLKGYYDLTLTDGVGVWDEEASNWKNKVTGEENLKLHETKVFQFRGYEQFLPKSN